MADSWNFPALARKIIEDVPFIKKALQALVKMDPSTINDVPTGAMRIVEVSTGKWEIQQYNGTAWVKLGKLNMDVETLDGYSASVSKTANTIPVRNASGAIQSDLTGNAATATTAQTLSQTLPVNKGGTGATTSAAARTNLGVPPTSHASSATTYGVASATSYGHAKASGTTPKAAGTATVGSETTAFARGDHVHPLQTTVSGNAGTATKWRSTRYIDGLGVDGSADCTRYATCSTAAATAAKTVNVTGFKLVTGACVCVRFTVTNTAANATLNVNSTGARAIRYKNAAIPANLIEDEGTYEFVYDGSYYQLVGGGSTGGGVPVGAVVAFSGTFGGTNNRFPIDAKTKLVNTNWCLCDGTTTNGIAVPDLRGRFIMGANTTYKAGSTGGSATHSHTISGTVGAVTLVESQLASHFHIQSVEGARNGDQYVTQRYWAADSRSFSNHGTTYEAGGSQSHTHSLSNVTSSNSNNLVPYYALAMIMRCA